MVECEYIIASLLWWPNRPGKVVGRGGRRGKGVGRLWYVLLATGLEIEV